MPRPNDFTVIIGARAELRTIYRVDTRVGVVAAVAGSYTAKEYQKSQLTTVIVVKCEKHQCMEIRAKQQVIVQAV